MLKSSGHSVLRKYEHIIRQTTTMINSTASLSVILEYPANFTVIPIIADEDNMSNTFETPIRLSFVGFIKR